MRMVKLRKKWRFIEVNINVNEEIVEISGIRCSNVKIEEIKMAVITVVYTTGGVNCKYCCKPGHVKQNCLKLKKEDSRLNNNPSGNSNYSNRDRENHDVKFVPDLWANLFSINQALKKGHKISNDKITISLSKVSSRITFNRVFKAKGGTLSGIKMMAYDNPVAYNSMNDVLKRDIEINRFHKMLGHCGSDRLEKTSRIYGFKLIGKVNECEECAVSKARKKNMKKEWKGGSQIPG